MFILKLNKISDFIIKIIIMFITFLAIMLFAVMFNSFTFAIIGIIYLLAITTRGITDFIIARRNYVE
jgi:hypothetical protein